jgi:hypothetical protein
VLTKLLRAISGSPDGTDWESVLTQVSESSHWSESEGLQNGRFGAFAQGRLMAAPDPNAPDVNLALLGLGGDEVHKRARLIAKRLHELATHGATVQQWNVLIRDVTALGDMGQTINSLAEVKLRKVSPKVQETQLLPLVGGVLAKRANDLRRSGVLLVPDLQSCSIDADPHLCKALIETAMEWAVPFGNRLTVTTEISSWGDAARLTIMADHVVRTQDDTPAMERTSIFLWELINELAQAAGVLVSRSQVDGKTAMAIEFPTPAQLLDGIANDEIRMQSSEAPTLQGRDILVYANKASARSAIDAALTRAGCHVRYASSLTHLVRECELSLPAALVTESELMDENVQTLIDDLRRHLRGFVVVEIVKTPNVYEMSLPGSKNNCRLSSASVDSLLHEALLFELVQMPSAPRNSAMSTL